MIGCARAEWEPRHQAGGARGPAEAVSCPSVQDAPLGAAHENGARQAFLLGLSDAVRPLLEPTAIQDVAARMLAEHLGVARAYYAEWRRGCGHA